MKKEINRVPMLSAAIVALTFLGIMHSWSIFRVEFSKFFPSWTASQLSMNFSIIITSFCLGGLIGGKVAARFSPRLTARISAIMIFAGFMACSLIEKQSDGMALITLYTCFGLLAGIGSGIAHNSCVGSVPLWFPKQLGLVSGVLFMCFGTGALVFGLAVEALSAVIGIFNVLRIIAVSLSTVLLIVSFFLKTPVIISGTDDNKSSPNVDFTSTEMLKSPSFWLFFLWNTLLASCGLLIINSAANIAVFFGAKAGIGLAISIFSGVGSVIGGILMDKLGKMQGILIMTYLLIVMGVILVITAVTNSAFLLIIGLIGVGISFGSGATVNSKYINDRFGSRHFSVNYTIANFSMMPASFIGPFISGLLQDISGNYTSTFVMLLASSVICLLMAFLLKAELKKPL